MKRHVVNFVSSLRHKRGSTLVIGMIMLVLLTLIAISAMNASITSVESVGNSQFREEALAAAQTAIEVVLSNSDFKTTPPPPQNVDVNNDGTADFRVVFTPAPVCLSYRPVLPNDPGVHKSCFGSVLTCYWTVWDVTAVVTDIGGSGATTTVHQGVRTLAGTNTALAQCGV